MSVICFWLAASQSQCYTNNMYLCIDIGGTKTIIALLNQHGKMLHSVRFATIANQSDFYDSLLQQIRANFVLSNIKVISVAMPGIVKRNRAVWLGNLPWKCFSAPPAAGCMRSR